MDDIEALKKAAQRARECAEAIKAVFVPRAMIGISYEEFLEPGFGDFPGDLELLEFLKAFTPSVALIIADLWSTAADQMDRYHRRVADGRGEQLLVRAALVFLGEVDLS